MKGGIITALLIAALPLAGCGDDSESYSGSASNCHSFDAGSGVQYNLCCTVTCSGHYDYDDDDYREQCTQQRSCSSSDGSPCPPEVIAHGYPPCPYYY